jgi:tetratricopeptide (TPR) repeat protein
MTMPLKHAPHDVPSMIALADTHLAAGRFDAAASLYRQLIERVPPTANLHHVLGLVYLEQGHVDKALNQLHTANQLAPDTPEILRSLGDAHKAADDCPSAVNFYEKALAIDPLNSEVLINLGNIRHAMECPDEARACFQKALEIEPQNKQALNNLGKTYLDMGRLEPSLACFDQCLQLHPEYAEARFNRSVLLLTQGDFTRGWQEYEWRFKRRNAHRVYPHKLSSPRWRGEPFHGGCLLVHAEQGMGDVLQFARYLPRVKQLGGRVILEAHPPLLPLLKTMNCIDDLVAFDKSKPPEISHDFHIPMLSLPALFATTLATIPDDVPYLRADAAKTQDWKKRITGSGLRVGLVWSGSPLNVRRNLPLEDCRSWFEAAGIHFFGLQKDVADDQLPASFSGLPFCSLGDRLNDFSDTAAAMANLDLIITVDTAAAHLAGAMGRPTWVLLPFSADWRWSPDHETTPWYPTVRMFRQPRHGQWAEVIADVGQALNRLAASENTVQLRSTCAPGSQALIKQQEAFQNAMQSGLRLLYDGDAQEARFHFQLAVEQNPRDPAACYNLGLALQQLNDLEGAIRYYQQALDLAPDLPQALANMGAIMLKQGRFDAAFTFYEKVVRLEPGKAGNHYNLGNVYLARQESKQSIASYQKALALDPHHHKSLNNMGRAWHQLGQYGPSRSCYEQAVALFPDYAEAHLNRAVSSLLLGHWEDGWQEYRWRFKCHDRHRIYPHNLDSPVWDGRPLKGRKILVHSEQGIGDALQFCRYLPLVKARGGHVIFEVRESLFPLFQSLRGVDELVTLSARRPFQGAVDWHLPLGDCPMIFHTTPHNIPNQTPYIFADPLKARRWQKRLPPEGPCVGLVWSGNDTYRERACSLNDMAELADLEGIAWIGLQKGPAASMADPHRRPGGLDVDNWGEEFQDFSDTAAVVANLDLVISIDTSVAHLAGAMGKPVWTILPAVPDWRWMLHRTDSPWYPSMRLFRQREPGQWAPVINEIVRSLQLFMSQCAARNPVPENYSRECSCRQSIEVKPDLADAHYHLALKLKNNGDIHGAIAAFEKATRLSPAASHIFYDLANTYMTAGCLEKAIRCYRQAVAIRPEFANALNNLGVALKNQGDADAAVQALEKAVALDPDNAEFHNNLGIACQIQGAVTNAIAHFEKAAALSPGFAEAYYNLGFLLQTTHELQAAVTCYEKAIGLKPDFFDAHNNLAVTLHNLGSYRRARTHYDRAVQMQPASDDARWNRSMLLLLNGEFEEGWREFEHRLTQSGRATNYPFKHPKPRWDGNPLRGKRLLIHDEQGYGDTLQFIRYLPLAKRLVGHLLFETRQPLVSLLHGFTGIDEIVTRTSTQRPDADYDFYTPLLSLPKLFGTGLGNIPFPEGYLQAHPVKTEYWGKKLDTNDVKVGIVWAGNPEHKNDFNRSCDLRNFKTLMDLEGVRFFSLQKDVSPMDWKDTVYPYKLEDCGKELHDFSDTAALVYHLDLIISVDTAVVHLAGAMGKPAWVLLPFVPDWRWLHARSDSPWYRSLRLFRQKARGDWKTVFQTVKEELGRITCQEKTSS